LARIRTGVKVTASDLASEFEVSVRTIQRDLDALRDDYGAPIVFDASLRSLRLTECRWRLSEVELTEAELFHLAVAAGMAGQFGGTPIAEDLQRLFRKLQDVLQPPLDLDPQAAVSWVRFSEGPARPIQMKVWTTLVRGAQECRQVRLNYRSGKAKQGKGFCVEPVYLACRRGDWYLVARHSGFDDSRVFAISRILKASLTSKRFSPRAHDFREDNSAVFSRFVAKGTLAPIQVRMRFGSSAAEWVRERMWHPEQVLTEHRDGGLTLGLPIDGDREALTWALKWGASGRVLSPAWLKREVLEEVTKMKEDLEGGLQS